MAYDVHNNNKFDIDALRTVKEHDFKGKKYDWVPKKFHVDEDMVSKKGVDKTINDYANLWKLNVADVAKIRSHVDNHYIQTLQLCSTVVCI